LGLHEGGGGQEVVVPILMLGGGILKQRILTAEVFVLFDKGVVWRVRGHVGVFLLLGSHVGVYMRCLLGRKWLWVK
jgi:hypothetical protein